MIEDPTGRQFSRDLPRPEDVPLGTLIEWSPPSYDADPPEGWALAGSEVSRSDPRYSRFFAAYGTAYGEGDGETTFRLPTAADAAQIGYPLPQLPAAAALSLVSLGVQNHGAGEWIRAAGVTAPLDPEPINFGDEPTLAWRLVYSAPASLPDATVHASAILSVGGTAGTVVGIGIFKNGDTVPQDFVGRAAMSGTIVQLAAQFYGRLSAGDALDVFLWSQQAQQLTVFTGSLAVQELGR